MTDTDRRDAERAVTWYLQRRDQTAPGDRPDPEADAAEIVQGLWGRGWRRTVAQTPPPWMPSTGRPADPADVPRLAQAARAAITGQTEEA